VTTADPIIRLDAVGFEYPGGRKVLDAVHLDLNPGDRIGLMGPNGSGKTTLFLLIMGLLKPSCGSIEIFGKPVRSEKDFLQVRRRIGLLFQDPDDQLFSPTVLEDVAFGPLNLGKSREEALGVARKTLNYLGLGGFEDRVTYTLSGGEKRLVSLATVLAMEPEVLLLDEPTNGLDEDTRDKIKQVLTEIPLSYILISHDLDFLDETTQRIFFMQDGRMFTDGRVQLHRHVHAHPHGAIPHAHEKSE